MPIQEQTFYPCEKKGCRFYGEWELKINPDGECHLTLPTAGILKMMNPLGAFSLKLAVCSTCVYFKRHNNFILKE